MEKDPTGDKFSMSVKVTKETLCFQNEEMTYIKVPKCLQGTSGVAINDETITVVE